MRLSTEFGILTEYTAFLAREGTDFSQKDKVLSEAENLFRNRAIQTRSGLSSANQDLNNQIQKSIMCVNPRNKFYDATMNEVATATVQQVCDLAFYKRRDRWVDSRLVTSAGRGRRREGHHVRLPGVSRSGRQAGARGTPGEHRAQGRHPDARRRPARSGQGARQRTVIVSSFATVFISRLLMERFP